MDSLSEKDREFIEKTKDKDSPFNLKKYCLNIPIKKLSELLSIDENLVVSGFSDGRVCSYWVEVWASKIYNFVKCREGKKYDGYIPVDSVLTKRLCIGIRNLTKHGLCFTQAQFNQNPSKWHPLFVDVSLRFTTFQIVCDIVDTPKIYFTPVLSTDVISLTYRGILKQKITRKEFYYTFFKKTLEEIENEFEVVSLENLK